MTFKVFNLQCEFGHLFEGWFKSHDDYNAQQENEHLSCPICNSKNIEKLLSAPHLNVKHSLATNEANKDINQNSAMTEKRLENIQASIIKNIRKLIKRTENVGMLFAEEARRIHRRETKERPIRGVVTVEEQNSLIEEGIEVLNIPNFLDDSSLH